jgi:hypothetical protein
MPNTLNLGAFELTSRTIVVTGPDYDLDFARFAGCFIKNCALGSWHVEAIEDIPPELGWTLPWRLHAAHDGTKLPSDPGTWRTLAKRISGGRALTGIYDLAHFQDHSVVPPDQKWTFWGEAPDPDDLWYPLNCEAASADSGVGVIPYGVVVHWDGGWDVDIIAVEKEVVAVRLTISGWPDKVVSGEE